MRNKGSKDKHGRYSSAKQMQNRAIKLSATIDKFIEQAWRQHDFNKLTDFNKLHDVRNHLIELSRLPIQ